MLPATQIVEEWKALVPQAPLPSTAPVQTLPHGYFEQVPELVLARLRQVAEWESEINSLSPLLAGLSQRSPQSIPQDYFTAVNLPLSKENVVPSGEAKPLAKLYKLRRSLQWAVAASLAGVLVVGAYFMTAPTSHSLPSQAALGVSLEKSLSAVGEDEMDQYLQKQTQLSLLANESNEDLQVDLENKIELLSEEELLQYLQQDAETAPAYKLSSRS